MESTMKIPNLSLSSLSVLCAPPRTLREPLPPDLPLGLPLHPSPQNPVPSSSLDVTARISLSINVYPKIQTLVELIRKASHCTALTGAGVSTLSGIRDFRGKNGLYNDADADKIFDIAYFEEDPSIYYKASASFIYSIDEKEPSVVHNALALLEQKGFLKSIITQNIDMLHQKAGSKNVIEIHGSPVFHYCLRCPGFAALPARRSIGLRLLYNRLIRPKFLPAFLYNPGN